jgi:hypothetical protein
MRWSLAVACVGLGLVLLRLSYAAHAKWQE